MSTGAIFINTNRVLKDTEQSCSNFDNLKDFISLFISYDTIVID